MIGMSNLRETERGIEVVPSRYEAGCFIMGAGFMLGASAVLLVFGQDLVVIKDVLAMLVGLAGVVFFGTALLKVLSKLWSRHPLFEVRGGYLQNRVRKVPLADIDELVFGWHSYAPSGMVFEDLVVRTIQNKRYFFPTYNLVSAPEIDKLVRTHILPYATTACREKWEAQGGGLPKPEL